ncbi:uncharacterized protein LOC111905485 [Lactuca sativa]|nr:uncharacterized protein LOC111905485 [Lactuca sativa]
MAIMLFIFFIFLRPPTTTARNPLAEVSSDDFLRSAAGYGEEKLSTVVVGGSLLCDVFLDGISNLQSNPITGASMMVSCNTGKKTSKSDWTKGRTDEYGDFLIDLPSHLHAVPNIEKKCIVRILHLPKTSPCHQALNGHHTRIKLSSVKNGFRTYTTHNIHLRPKKHTSRNKAM